MTFSDPRLCRSLLFVPAANGRALAKARDLAADLLILDCEDSVKVEEKAAARQAACDAARTGFEGRPCAIRINAADSPWYAEDCAAVADSAAAFVVLPKVETAEAAAAAARETGKPVLAMIETAAGVLAAASIARAAAGLIAGTNDLRVDLGMPPTDDRTGLAHALQSIVLAARAAGVAVFDGVYNGLADDDALAVQCREGRLFGFDGKSLIHPSQIETANRLFSPGTEEIEVARRLVAAASGGAERFEGRMVEAMHVEQARAVLAKARA